MKYREEDILKIGKALAAAHRLRQEPKLEPGVDFSSGVMQSIRDLRRRERKPACDSALYEQTVWRFASGACLLVLLFLAWSIHSGSGSLYHLIELILDESAGVSITQSFGVL